MIDWQTDEGNEQLWEEEHFSTTAVSRRWWLWLFILLLLLGLGTWLGFQVNERVQRNIELLRDQIRQQHALVYTAALAQDHTLFDYLNAASDIEWRVLQRLLLRENLLLNRAPLNIWVDTTASPIALETAVNLSTTLDEATVESIYPYFTQTVDGRLESIQLRHTFFYKKRNDIWYEAAPDEDFWGESLEYQGSVLQTFYTDRDKLIARRFAEDLDAFVSTLCADEGLICTDDVPLRLLFQTDSTALYRLTDNVRLLETKRVIPIENGRYENVHEISLPTPSLVGYPMDEASYRAIYRGYAAWIGLLLLQNRSPGLSPSHTENVATLAKYELLPPTVSRYSPLANRVPPIPLPNASLYLMCADTDGIHAWLYSVSQDSWTRLGAPFQPTTLSAPARIDPLLAPDIEEQLLDALPRAERPLQLTIESAVKENDRIGIVAQANDAAPFFFIFLQNHDTLLFLDKVRNSGPSILPVSFEGNGRFLSVPTFNSGRTTLYLIDTTLQLDRQAYGFTSSYPTTGQYRWAPDGRWFTIIDDRAIRLIAPEVDFEKIVYHNNAGCRLGQWTQ